MTEQFFKIEKLNTENYPAWCFRMKSYLIIEGLWDVIESEPSVNNDEDWKRRDEIALSKINLLVEDSQIPYIIEAKTAKEAWMSLRLQHQKFSSKVLTFRSLSDLKLAEGGDVEKHITLFSKYNSQLRVLGLNLPDMVLVALLLASLPSSYLDLMLDVDNMINLRGIQVSYNKVCDMVLETGKKLNKSPSKQYRNAMNISLSDANSAEGIEKLINSPSSPRQLRNRC